MSLNVFPSSSWGAILEYFVESLHDLADFLSDHSWASGDLCSWGPLWSIGPQKVEFWGM